MPNWGISIVLKNEHGFNTIVTPVIDEKNKTNALIFFTTMIGNTFILKLLIKTKNSLNLKNTEIGRQIIFQNLHLKAYFNHPIRI